jgi:putative peptide zinc metalloprotease protein
MSQNPKLRMDLKVFRQEKEGDLKRFVIKDLATEKFFRVSEYEYRVLKALDGTVSIEQAVEKLKSQGYFYELADAKLVMSKAEQLGLLLNTRYGTSEFQATAKKRMDSQKRTKQLSGVYFRYIPLFNPDNFLERTLWVFDLFVNKYTATFMLLLLPVALYFVVTGVESFKSVYLFFFNFNNLLILWTAIALSKLIHEFAHAYTAKHYGIRVPEMGVGILMFFPVLYSNVTDAWQLGDRRQRMAIAGAGIIAEAVIAILATFVWTFTKPGIVNSLAFYMMAMSFVSTLLFNGNPLMKFDGYFVLVDYMQLPNLWAKSMKYVKHLWMEKVLGLSNYPDPSNTDRERKIFGVYGFSLFAYRISLYTGIVINVYRQFDKLLGILLGAMAFFLFIVKPVYTGSKTLYAKRGEIKIKRKGGLVFLGIVVVFIVMLFIPLSSKSIFPCYMASKQVQKLSVPLLTMVRKVFIEQGSVVKKGQILYELDPTQLELLLRQKYIQRSVIKAEVQLLLLDDENKGKAPAKEAELKQVDNEIRRIEEDLKTARTGNVAPFNGVVTMLDYRMQPGYKPADGVIVGEIKSIKDGVVHALVPALSIDKVRVGMDAEIWFPIGAGFFFDGKVDEVAPYSEKDLRDSPFSSRHGGELATEVISEGHKDAPLEAVYRCSVNFSNDKEEVPLGMTGRMAVTTPPQTVFMKFVNQIFNVFNRESFF